jgi:hypothetical protein
VFYTNLIFVERNIRCLDDCRQSGCPGHVIRIEINDTVGIGTYLKDGEIKCIFDSIEAENLFDMLKEIKET